MDCFFYYNLVVEATLWDNDVLGNFLLPGCANFVFNLNKIQNGSHFRILCKIQKEESLS